MAENGKVVDQPRDGARGRRACDRRVPCRRSHPAQGKQVAMFLTKEAVRFGLPGHAEGVACDGCPPLSRLFDQYAEGGGELLVCPICFRRASSTKARS